MYTTVIVPKRSDNAAMVYSVPVIRRNYSLLVYLLLDLFLNSNSIFLKLSEFNYHIIKQLNPVGLWPRPSGFNETKSFHPRQGLVSYRPGSACPLG